MAQQRTLKELAAPNLDQQPLCIQYPSLDVNFELKSGLIHLLPSFHGLPGEDPNKHLKEFHIVCSIMKPAVVTEEQMKLRAFPFSLKDVAKEWLYYLSPGTVKTWNGMKTMFLERYFPSSKVGNIGKEICGIRQYTGESLYEYWERFKRLCASCPHHQISEQLLFQCFYEGLQSLGRSMIDAASGGALVDKTPVTTRSLISNMAANSQQFGIRQDLIPPPKSANEVSTSNANQLGQQLAQLTAVVQQLALGQHVRSCGIYQVVGHATDTCPTLVEGETEGVNAVGNFPGQLRQMYYEPFSQTYNPGWRDHPNLRYGNQQQIAPQPTSARPPGFTLQQQSQNNFVPRPSQPPQAAPPPSAKPSTEDLINALATNTLQFQKTTQASIKSLENQNPKENASAVTLRSGMQYDPPSPPMPGKLSSKPQVDCSVNEDVPPKPTTLTQLNPKRTFVIPPPFPSRLKKTKKEEVDKEIFDTFRKVEVNIPLLDAIKQVSRYAKFLKELCTNKRKLRGNEKAMRYPSDVHAVYSLDVLGILSQQVLDLHSEDCLEVALREHLVLIDEDFSHEIMDVITTLNSGFDKTFKKVAFLNLPISNEKLQPSIVQAPNLN
ncbi:uncharacterized protein LOC133815441 [Humulus lupulus]|uniref:uncharacterized protein LOC133815441 n=1 Tax=Humulus lupulus TaxID=3486 RepID=UPI002B40D92A|nr:uncharacterized protein LOC133815441 [Humulus lupulus]